MKRPPRKLATTIFEHSVLILGVSFNVNLSLQIVKMSFSTYEITICFLLYNLLYQLSMFEVFMEHLKLRIPKMAFLLSMERTGFPQVLI